MKEVPLVFPCRQSGLVGILHEGDRRDVGIVVVTGGPQYRIGSHRQFALLARFLAAKGYPVLRFDCRGMGDSGGEFPGFDHLDDDIRAAVDTLFEHVPSLRHVILWGLCYAASATLIYAPSDRRVTGLALLNPWVRTDSSLARTQLRHYYGARVLEREFWKKLVGGGVPVRQTLRELAINLRKAFGRRSGSERGRAVIAASRDEAGAFLDRMAVGLRDFDGPILIVLSGNDLTAAEFESMAESTWPHLLQRPGMTWCRIENANHTFASQAWRDQVAQRTADWLADLPSLPRDSASRNGPG